MNGKKTESKKKVVYAEQEERVFCSNYKEEVIHQLKDVVSCLNFCDYELDKIKKKISDKIHQLDSSE